MAVLKEFIQLVEEIALPHYPKGGPEKIPPSIGNIALVKINITRPFSIIQSWVAQRLKEARGKSVYSAILMEKERIRNCHLVNTRT